MRTTKETDRRLFAGEVIKPNVEIKDSVNLIQDNCIMLKLVISGLSFEKKVNSNQVMDANNGVDATLMRVTKSTISKQYLQKINSLDSQTRTAIANLGFRPSFMHSGFVLIPRTAVRYAEETLKSFKSQREALVQELADSMEFAKSNARLRLGNLYSESDYPSPKEIIAKFTVEHQYHSTQAPADLEEMDKEAFLEQKRKAEETWSSAKDEVVQSLRVGFAELVESMLDKVTGINDGKIFKQGFVERMRNFLETFDLLNITNDTELESLVQRARMVLDGETPDSMKSREDVRIKVEKTFTSIKSSLDEMTMTGDREIFL